MQRIAVVDTGMCNVDSMQRALEECGADVIVTCAPSDLDSADKIVLPGVGAFPDAMAALDANGLVDSIRENVLQHEVPILGVCLGMQLLVTKSDEVVPTLGLDLIGGHVVRLEPVANERVPHVGWNEVYRASDHWFLRDARDGEDYYFVHSYHVLCDKTAVVGTTPYCAGVNSVIGIDHIVGTQFHPEKSQSAGIQLLRRFVEF